MLTAPKHRELGPTLADSKAAQICTICDGLDAVLTLAAYVAAFPQQGQRTDLSFAEAIEALKAHDGPAFTKVLIAPNLQQGVSPQATLAIIEAALTKAETVTVILPPKVTFAVAPNERLKVMQGPPFKALQLRGEVIKPAENTRGLGQILARFGRKRAANAEAAAPAPEAPKDSKDWRVIAVQPLCGGAGSTTFAVNFAAELAEMKPSLSVCLIDLDLQFGNIGTYLNLAANSRISDAYRDVQVLDAEAFQMCIHRIDETFFVLAAPEEILPPDAIDNHDIAYILELAKGLADVVILDLPPVISDMTGAVMKQADRVIGVAKLDVRSAQNGAKLRHLCQSEGLSAQKFGYVLNFAPGKKDRMWQKSKVEFERGLQQSLLAVIPDAGLEVTAACNAGEPLREHAPSSPARSAIRKLCDTMRPKLGHLPKAAASPKKR